MVCILLVIRPPTQGQGWGGDKEGMVVSHKVRVPGAGTGRPHGSQTHVATSLRGRESKAVHVLERRPLLRQRPGGHQPPWQPTTCSPRPWPLLLPNKEALHPQAGWGACTSGGRGGGGGQGGRGLALTQDVGVVSCDFLHASNHLGIEAVADPPPTSMWGPPCLPGDPPPWAAGRGKGGGPPPPTTIIAY